MFNNKFKFVVGTLSFNYYRLYPLNFFILLFVKVKSTNPDLYFFERLVVELLVEMGYGGSIEEADPAIVSLLHHGGVNYYCIVFLYIYTNYHIFYSIKYFFIIFDISSFVILENSSRWSFFKCRIANLIFLPHNLHLAFPNIIVKRH